MEDQTVKNPDKGGVQSVARIFELIEVLAAHPAGASLQRLAEDAHLAKSTTHRLLGSLVSLGYAAQDSETGKYRLTLKMFEISSGIVNSMDVMSVAKVHLERLAQRTGEAVHLVIRDAQDIVYIYKTESGPMRMSSPGGAAQPAVLYRCGQSHPGYPDRRRGGGCVAAQQPAKADGPHCDRFACFVRPAERGARLRLCH